MVAVEAVEFKRGVGVLSFAKGRRYVPPLGIVPVLVIGWKGSYCCNVSMVELLKQVKAWPPRQRQEFVKAVLTLEQHAPARARKATRRVKWPDVQARAKRIFGDRVLPNLVLLEREETSF